MNIKSNWLPLIVVIVIVSVTAAIYLSSNLRASDGNTPIMPLDDAYIHFQYARAFADGYPLHYNPDQPPTSGATSLLYPIILAVGYKLGFTGEQLGWWAFAIGILSWLASTWLVYRIAARDRSTASRWIGLFIAVAFALTGSLGWAFMSGMETGLMILATLLTLWYVSQDDWRGVVFAGTIAALLRPEGVVIGVLAVIYIAVRERKSTSARPLGSLDDPLVRPVPDPKGIPLSSNAEGVLLDSDSPRPAGEGLGVRAVRVKRILWLTLPLIAALIQPVVNFLATGSATASGLQAKSFLYIVPPNMSVIASNIIGTALRLWTELLTGISPDDGMYFIFVLSWLALIALILGLRKTLVPNPSLSGRGESESINSPSLFAEKGTGGEVLILFWLLGLTATLSLLQTAFWQFKRYQQPMITLLFPLAAWTLMALYRLPQQRIARAITILLLAILLGGSIFTTVTFVRYYAENVHEVASSQKPMAANVATSVPAGAVIGVHDIGVMRYLGNHPTYDVIGLTTPGAARAWQNGPGAAYEQMAASPWRPDYFAIYNDALGLKYFADTDLFKNPPLASFPSTRPERNIASATNGGQAVYKADWTFAEYASQPWQPSSLAAISNMKLIDSVNVANLASEDAHSYHWWQDVVRPGFASEVYEQDYVACQPPKDNPSCRIIDGGRLITGGEEMIISTIPGQDMIWITRVHPRNAATLNVFVNSQKIGTRIVPAIPGQWLEIASYVPGKLITSSKTTVRVEANITDPTVGHYMPYYHWFYQGDYHHVSATSAYATFGQSIALAAAPFAYFVDTRLLNVVLVWQLNGPAPTTDIKVFVHLYDSNHLDSPPIAQVPDQRPGQGTLPPANWIGGVQDTYEIKVPPDAKPGTYSVAIGLYDVVTQQRLPVTGDGSDKDQRLFIGTVTIP